MRALPVRFELIYLFATLLVVSCASMDKPKTRPSYLDPKPETDQVQIKCMDIFNASFANQTYQMSFCGQDQNQPTNYELAVSMWKFGVSAGEQIGFFNVMYEGSLDAEVAFAEKDHLRTQKFDNDRNQAMGTAQSQLQQILGRMPYCYNSGLANQMFQAAKSCGTGISEAINSNQYESAYEYICLGSMQKVTAKQCETFADQAFFKYVLRKKQETAAPDTKKAGLPQEGI